MDWYLLGVNNKSVDALRDLGYVLAYPCVTETRKHRRSKRNITITKPVLEGYAFCWLSVSQLERFSEVGAEARLIRHPATQAPVTVPEEIVEHWTNQDFLDSLVNPARAYTPRVQPANRPLFGNLTATVKKVAKGETTFEAVLTNGFRLQFSESASF